MNGAQVYETALPSTAKRLFFATWPGWTGSSYRHRDLYAEDRYLADMLPLSSTFTAHLKEAEAIYDGTNGNLVGARTFVGGSPQHAVLLGMTGVGKSHFMDDLLAQIIGRTLEATFPPKYAGEPGEEALLRVEGLNGKRRTWVQGLDGALVRCFEQNRLPSELGESWAVAGREVIVGRLSDAHDVPVAARIEMAAPINA